MPEEPNRVDPVTPAHAELRHGPGGAVLVISGALNLETAAMTRRQVEAALRAAPVATLEVNASGVDRGDVSGI